MRTVTTVAFASSLFWASAASFAQQPNFSGVWTLNEALSQNPLEKIDQALGGERAQGTGSRTYNSVSSGTLLRDSDLRETLTSLLDFARVLGDVEIDHTADEIKIWVGDGEEFFSLFYLDGEKHARELSGGLRIEASAAWEGESIHILQVGANDAVLKQILSPAGDDKLALVFVLESKLSETPIQFRVVYDRIAETS